MKYLLIILIVVAGKCMAQSGYYWSQNYGLEGQLLNGAVIAGTEDNSSIYYNPSTITNVKEKSRFSISGFSGTYSLLRHENGAGKNSNLKYGKFEILPAAIAGSFKPFNKNSNTSLYFGVFRRNFYNFEVQSQFHSISDHLTSNPGDESLEASFLYQDKLKESWLTFGGAHQFKSNFSVGGGLIFAFMNRNYRINWIQKVEQNSNILKYYNEDLSFTHSMKLNMLLKMGISWQKNGYKIGFTLTSPTLFSAIDKGVLNYSYGEQRVDSSLQIKNDFDVKLKGKYKMPFSIGMGFELPLGEKVRITLSGEYFHKLKTYNMLSPKTKSAEEHHYFSNQANWVLNGALGLHVNLKKEHIDLLGGFRTNYSNNRKSKFSSINHFQTLNASIYNVSFGSIFRIKQNTFSLGLEYGFTPNKSDRSFVNITDVNIEEANDLRIDYSSDVKLHLITFIFAYELFK